MALTKISTFANRLNQALEEDNLKPTDLASKIGMSKQAISTYSTGLRIPKRPVVNAISVVLNRNPLWLLGYDVKEHLQSFSFDNIHINIYGRVPAGTPFEAIEDIIGDEVIPHEWLSGGSEFIGLKVAGDSMYPRYLDGDIVIIKLQPDCESGQDAVVYVNGYDATLKTVIKQPDGNIRLQPANPEFQPKIFNSDNVTILGVVKRLRRDF